MCLGAMCLVGLQVLAISLGREESLAAWMADTATNSYISPTSEGDSVCYIPEGFARKFSAKHEARGMRKS
jgi:hypothetical protein